jgi:xanthine dehydrogenase accessory factor
MRVTEVLERTRDLTARAMPHAVVTVVRAIAPTSAYVGAQAIVLADGTIQGWIGGGCTQGVVVDVAKAAIDTGEPKLIRITNDRMQDADEIEQHVMSCASNGTIELFIQPYSAGHALYVAGRTPAADEARFLAERLRIRLVSSVGDARVVLIATQGEGDEAALERHHPYEYAAHGVPRLEAAEAARHRRLNHGVQTRQAVQSRRRSVTTPSCWPADTVCCR